MKKKRVIIIGGGFGGLNAAKALKNADVEVLLIDKSNHHLFQPLLYQVASAALSPANIAAPLREVLASQENASVIMAHIEHIDKDNKQVIAANGEVFAYDELIVAPGARHHYFGNDQWESFAPGLKTLEDAIRIREGILTAFERAERLAREGVSVDNHLRFVIVGGGPTGVEMAGAIAEIAHKTMFRNFRHINPEQSEIYLIEHASRLLPPFTESLSAKAKTTLEKMGVKVLTNAKVIDVNESGVQVGEQLIETTNVIWAAGNQASSLLKTLEVELDSGGRVKVEPDLTLPGYKNIFVIGDAAHVGEPPLPGIAPVAVQQGYYAAQKLLGKTTKPFIYRDKGTIATIGKAKAVAMIHNYEFSGFFAWLIWSVVHVFYLVSFRNRLVVLLQWMFYYVTGRRTNRLIKPSILELCQ